METLRPNQQRAKATIILLWIVLCLDILSAISDLMQYHLLQDAANGITVTEEEASANDLREMIIGIVYMVAYFSCGIVFLYWFRRAYYNLHQRASVLSYTEGWAAGSWFVPILCLFRPVQIMRELFTVTDAILANQIPGYAPKANKLVIGFWWALWIITSFIGNIILRYSFRADTLDQIIASTIANFILSLLSIPLGFLIIKLVKDYSDMENLLFELKEEIIVGPSDEDPAPVSVV
jgi:hypothetical protein